jgi:hypothetical protein
MGLVVQVLNILDTTVSRAEDLYVMLIDYWHPKMGIDTNVSDNSSESIVDDTRISVDIVHSVDIITKTREPVN